jgi:two-component system sensor histidine kinase BaeS
VALSLLVNDLQDLALADAGALSLHPHRQALAPILEQAVAAQQATAAARQITLAMQAAPTLEAPVDALRLGQVLRNLLANALVHTPTGGQVTLAAQQAAGSVLILVRDSGKGIAPEHLPHIFDRFYRADPSRDRTTGGAGIGLSVARSIVAAHGGKITVESIVDAGTTFRIILPVEQQGAGSAGDGAPVRVDAPPTLAGRVGRPSNHRHPH